jgi:hypothetical protein
MLERCRRITRFIGPGREAFLASEELQDAVIRNVEVIGEAAKRVSADARGRLNQLDWKAICGMRDVLIHDYSASIWMKCGTSPRPGYRNSRRHWSSSSPVKAPGRRRYDIPMTSHAGTRNGLSFRNPEARRIKYLARDVTGRNAAQRPRFPLALPIP